MGGRKTSGDEGQWVAPGVKMMALPPKSDKRRADRRDELTPQAGSVVPVQRYDNLDGPALVSAIRSRGQMTQQLGYRPARHAMFRVIDNVRGVVEGIYTGRTVQTDGIPSADGRDGMNTEHGWPQSKGVRGTPAKYDLHHLFPSNTYANGRRGNFPFGVVSGKVRWQEAGSKLGFDSGGRVVFEPRPGERGRIARALFYVSAVYGLDMPRHEEDALRQWHAEEPPDAAEVARNDAISQYQGNRNPFIDQPELVDKISRFEGAPKAKR